jgi:hypothetical protein
MTVCPCCNSNLSFARPPTIRIHQLAKQKVVIIPDGQPDPVEELKTATKKLEKLEADKAKLAAENKTLKAKVTKLTLESKKRIEDSRNTPQGSKVLKENVDGHACAELEKERQIRMRQLHALHMGEQKRLLRQLEDSKEAYETLLAGFEPVGLTMFVQSRLRSIYISILPFFPKLS